ncbi:hypothetical protein C8R47DRAFT_1070719 [Mycena vitilis]|nr:hypothetical protein C8R47DRAFT_1070719 [Mycena vitilis]
MSLASNNPASANPVAVHNRLSPMPHYTANPAVLTNFEWVPHTFGATVLRERAVPTTGNATAPPQQWAFLRTIVTVKRNDHRLGPTGNHNAKWADDFSSAKWTFVGGRPGTSSYWIWLRRADFRTEDTVLGPAFDQSYVHLDTVQQAAHPSSVNLLQVYNSQRFIRFSKRLFERQEEGPPGGDHTTWDVPARARDSFNLTASERNFQPLRVFDPEDNPVPFNRVQAVLPGSLVEVTYTLLSHTIPGKNPPAMTHSVTSNVLQICILRYGQAQAANPFVGIGPCHGGYAPQAQPRQPQPQRLLHATSATYASTQPQQQIQQPATAHHPQHPLAMNGSQGLVGGGPVAHLHLPTVDNRPVSQASHRLDSHPAAHSVPPSFYNHAPALPPPNQQAGVHAGAHSAPPSVGGNIAPGASPRPFDGDRTYRGDPHVQQTAGHSAPRNSASLPLPSPSQMPPPTPFGGERPYRGEPHAHPQPLFHPLHPNPLAAPASNGGQPQISSLEPQSAPPPPSRQATPANPFQGSRPYRGSPPKPSYATHPHAATPRPEPIGVTQQPHQPPHTDYAYRREDVRERGLQEWAAEAEPPTTSVQQNQGSFQQARGPGTAGYAGHGRPQSWTTSHHSDLHPFGHQPAYGAPSPRTGHARPALRAAASEPLFLPDNSEPDFRGTRTPMPATSAFASEPSPFCDPEAVRVSAHEKVESSVAPATPPSRLRQPVTPATPRRPRPSTPLGPQQHGRTLAPSPLAPALHAMTPSTPARSSSAPLLDYNAPAAWSDGAHSNLRQLSEVAASAALLPAFEGTQADGFTSGAAIGNWTDEMWKDDELPALENNDDGPYAPQDAFPVWPPVYGGDVAQNATFSPSPDSDDSARSGTTSSEGSGDSTGSTATEDSGSWERLAEADYANPSDYGTGWELVDAPDRPDNESNLEYYSRVREASQGKRKADFEDDETRRATRLRYSDDIRRQNHHWNTCVCNKQATTLPHLDQNRWRSKPLTDSHRRLAGKPQRELAKSCRRFQKNDDRIFRKFDRTRLTEEQFTQALEERDVEQHIRTRFEGFTIDENAEDGYPVTVRARDLDKDEVLEIKTKYLVGADALLEKYGGIEGVTQEVAMREAIEALQPFELEFLEVSWGSVKRSRRRSVFKIFKIGSSLLEMRAILIFLGQHNGSIPVFTSTLHTRYLQNPEAGSTVPLRPRVRRRRGGGNHPERRVGAGADVEGRVTRDVTSYASLHTHNSAPSTILYTMTGYKQILANIAKAAKKAAAKIKDLGNEATTFSIVHAPLDTPNAAPPEYVDPPTYEEATDPVTFETTYIRVRRVLRATQHPGLNSTSAQQPKSQGERSVGAAQLHIIRVVKLRPPPLRTDAPGKRFALRGVLRAPERHLET